MVMPLGLGLTIVVLTLAILLIAVIGTLSIFGLYLLGRGCLASWAQEQGYRILRCRFRVFDAGSFSSWNNIGMRYIIFFFRIRDSRGCVRSGWARCHIAWIDKWGVPIEVVWQDGLTDIPKGSENLVGQPKPREVDGSALPWT